MVERFIRKGCEEFCVKFRMDEDDGFGWDVNTIAFWCPVLLTLFPFSYNTFLFGAWATSEFLRKRRDTNANGWRRGSEFFSDAGKAFEVKHTVGHARRVCQDRIG